jgi:hypothetical protein
VRVVGKVRKVLSSLARNGVGETRTGIGGCRDVWSFRVNARCRLSFSSLLTLSLVVVGWSVLTRVAGYF